MQDTAEQEAQQAALSERMRLAAQAALLTTVPLPSYGSTSPATSSAAKSSKKQKPAEYFEALLEQHSSDDHDHMVVDSDDEDDDEDDDEEQQQSSNKKGSSSVITKSSKSSKGSNSSTASPAVTAATTTSSKTNKNKKKKQPKRKSQQQQPVIVLASGKPERPTRSCLLHIFYFIESFGIITCCCILVTQVGPLCLGMTIKDIGYVSAILKLYLSLFCILFILVEYDVPISFLQTSKFIQTYFSRGFLYR